MIQTLEAQLCKSKPMQVKLKTTIVSVEHQNQSGQFQYKIGLKALDSIWIDSIQIDSAFFSSFQSDLTGSRFLDSGDTDTIVIDIFYDSSSLPYYYDLLEHKILCHTPNNEPQAKKALSSIYFTLYGTTEVWNMDDFTSLPRLWETQNTPPPARVAINKNSIPISNRPSLDAINEEWETDFQHVFYPGLPYAIEMKAAHPDSLQHYRDLDSINAPTDTINDPNSIIIGKTFKGRVRGRLTTTITNDLGQTVQIPLAGILVKVKEDDIFGNPGNHTGYNLTLTWGYTNDNGDFDLSYSVFQSVLEGNQIEPYLEFVTKSRASKFNFKVKRKGAGDEDNPFKLFFKLGNQGKNIDIQTGQIELERGDNLPFMVANWVYLGYRFFEDNSPNNRPNTNYRLRIKIFADGSNYLGVATPFTCRILLEEGDESHETVIWHELGHHIMEVMMPAPNIPGTGGTHASRTEANFGLAWSEGWATSFMGMLDFYYRELDEEHGRYSFFEAGTAPSNFIPSVEIERMNRFWLRGFGTGNGANGIRSEYLVACALNDLFDGNLFSNTPNEFSDELGTAHNSAASYDLNESDEVCLPSKIFEALTLSQSASVDEYYENLLSLISDCETRKNIKTVFDQNRINLATNRLQIASNNLNADEVHWLFNLVDPDPDHNMSTLIKTDIDEIENNTFNLNNRVGAFWSTYKTLTDNLTLQNGGTLQVNNSGQSGFSSQQGGLLTQSNIELNLHSCSDRIDVRNNGNLEVGDPQGDETANFIVKENSILNIRSTFSPEPAEIFVHNNSSLIIEEGGVLQIGVFSRIVLDGPNAVLHIKGDVILDDNVDFEVFGGPNGKGYVIWESNYVNGAQTAHLIPGSNCKARFSQNNWSVKALECRGNGGFETPWNLKELEINDCTVQFGVESKLVNNAYNTKVEDVIFRGFLSSHSNPSFDWKLNSKGFWQLGRRNSFKKVRFIECTEGITIFNNGTSEPLKLEDVEFLSCNKGIRNWAGRIHWNEGYIKQNYIDLGAADVNTFDGILGIGAQSISIIHDVEMLARDNSSTINPITTQKTFNMHLQGSGRYHLSKSRLYDANYGIYTNQESIFKLCGEMRDNDNQLTLHQRATLGLGPNRWNNIHFTGVLNGDHRVINGITTLRLFLNNGANRFVGPDGSSGLKPFIFSELVMNQKFDASTVGINTRALPGAFNLWETKPTSGVGPIYFPAAGFNMALDNGATENFDINYTPIFTPPGGAPDWETAKNTFCGGINSPFQTSTGWVALAGGYVDNTHARYGAGSNMGSLDVETVFIQNGNTNSSLVKTKMHDLYQTSSVNPVNYDNLITYGEQLSYIKFPDEIAWVNYELYKLVQDIYPELHSDTFYLDSIVATMEPGIYSKLLNWSSALMVKTTEPLGNWRHFKFELVRDRALIHRNFGDRTDALTWLDQEIPNFTKPHDIAELQNWRCIIATEKEYLDGNITLDELFKYGCLAHLVDENLNQAHIWDPTDFNSVNDGDSFVEGGTPNMDDVSSIVELEEGLMVYPNPSSSVFYYKNSELKNINHIRIFSINGRLIKDIANPSEEGKIDLSDQTNGLYIISFDLDDKAIRTKVLLMK